MENTYHHTQLPEGRIPALRVEPMPADTNQSGEVFGGWVMSQVDLAGANTAMRYALSRYIVTRAVSSLTFEAPVLVGDVVSFYTEIIKVGRTSLSKVMPYMLMYYVAIIGGLLLVTFIPAVSTALPQAMGLM